MSRHDKGTSASPIVVILLPAFNEEETIGMVIDEIPIKKLKENGYHVEIVVVNGPSTDRTASIAQEKGVIVYNVANGGKAKDVKEALQIINFHYDYLVMLDSDYTYPTDHIYDIVKALEEHDVVLGSRLRGKIENDAMPFLNRLGNLCLSLMATVLYRRRVSDVCTGMWGFRRQALDKINIDAEDFDLEVNLYVESVKNGLRIGEIPITYRRRSSIPKLGNGSRLGAIKTGFRIGWYLFKKRIYSDKYGSQSNEGKCSNSYVQP